MFRIHLARIKVFKIHLRGVGGIEFFYGEETKVGFLPARLLVSFMSKFILGITLALSGWVFGAPALTTIEDLKKVEGQIQKVVRDHTDATVSLVSQMVGSSGSGVIVSEDGLILTAAHVIEGSKEMMVLFPDGSQEKAKVLGANYTRDAAMAQLVGEGPWPFVELGNSDELEVGDIVVSMGHPKGYDPTRRPPVRFGRVMTKGDLGFITTDCTLIGGDSGGPLFDLEGRVVGIHSHIAAEKEINNHAGVSGFKRSWEKMKEGRSWGALMEPGPLADSPMIGISLSWQGDGAVVEGVAPNGPADQGGIQGGDRILKLGGMELKALDELGNIFADFEAGDVIEVELARKGEEKVVEVKLARLQEIYSNRRR